MSLSTVPEDNSRNFWLDRPVLVTGSTGILGSWLTLALLDLGANVVSVIRDWVPQSQLVRSGGIGQVKVVRGDITDAALMERVMAEYEIDTAIHLAAQTAVGIANRSPISTFETNIKGTWVLLEAARRWPGLSRVIVASSDKAYGAHAMLPYAEDAALQGRHPYDVSKSCADLLAQSYASTFNLPVTITRCANMYGGGDLNWNRIVPGTIRSVLRGERPVVRSDGTPLRDYIYVQDIVSAYLTLAEAMEGDLYRGEAFNFGMDAPVSALDMVSTIVRLAGQIELQPQVLNQASNEIQEQYLSSEKAHDLLGWQPRYSLEVGLRETIEWYREFLGTPPNAGTEGNKGTEGN